MKLLQIYERHFVFVQYQCMSSCEIQLCCYYVTELFLCLTETYIDTEQMHHEDHICSSKCHCKICRMLVQRKLITCSVTTVTLLYFLSN